MTFTPSDRLKKIDASGIRKVFDLAAKLENPINMSIGQPHFDVFASIKEAAITAIRHGFNAYTPTQGDRELIQLLKSHLKASRGQAPEDLFITSGVSGGLHLALQTLLNPADEIILSDPFFVMYKYHTLLCDAHPLYLDTYPDFTYRQEALRALITPNTKAILLNSPGNPTGKVMSETEIEEVIEVAREHDLYLITDEIYEAFIYDIDSLPSPYGKYDKCILLSGFSKSFGATGWRVGYVAGPAEVLQEMKKLQQYTYVCAPSMAQRALITFLQEDNQRILKKHIEEYREKRDLFYSLIKDRFDTRPSQGAFYSFIPAPKGQGEALVEKAIQNNLLIIPGSVFSNAFTHVRVSFATSEANIRQGADILNRLAADA